MPTDFLIKVGNQFAGDVQKLHLGFRDSQIIDIGPAGKFGGDVLVRHYAILRFPFDYWSAIGTNDIREDTPKHRDFLQYIVKQDENGYRPWDAFFIRDQAGAKTVRPRNWIIDLAGLIDKGHITNQQYLDFYDKSKACQPIDINADFTTLISHESANSRIDTPQSRGSGSISTGSYTVGSSGASYTTWSAAIADIITLTGNLTITGNANESISNSGDTIVNISTATYTLTFGVDSGAKHTGTLTSGHRITQGAFSSMQLDETTNDTLNKVIIQDINIDATASSSYGWLIRDGGVSDPAIVERNIIAGTSSSRNGLDFIDAHQRIIVRNNVVYGFANTGTGYGFGIRLRDEFDFTQWEIYNNTVAKTHKGIGADSSTPGAGTMIVKNNLCQGNTTDYTQTSSFDTTATNVSQDATSPDASYQSLNKQSVFTNYASDDYSLASSDTDLDDGADLSAIGSPAQFSDDYIGQTRSTWYIGASEYVAAGAAGGLRSPLYGPLYGRFRSVV